MGLRKVVVTGFGSISPFGIGVPVLMENLEAGKSAVENMKLEWENTIEDLNSWVGAPVHTELDEKSIPRKYRKTMGRSAILATLAVKEACQDAKISEEQLGSGRAGVSFGSSTGSVDSTEKFFNESFNNKSLRQISSGMFFQIMSHTAAANIAQAFNITGRVVSANAACSSSAQAIGLGFEAIQNGTQDIMLCGGTDELHAMTTVSFDIVQAASFKYNDRPEQTPRPFDQDRDGTVCGEGAGCIILESEESAKARGAKIYGEISGFATFSSGVHIAQPDQASIEKCINFALEQASIKTTGIDYINAHATGTLVGDVSEAKAIKEVFGDSVPVSGFKGYFGHTLGASAVLELIASFKMLEENKILPTKNLLDIDPECSGIFHVQKALSKKTKYFVKNSFAFGGINTVLIAKRNNHDRTGNI